MFGTLREVAFGEDCFLKFCGRRYLECDRENQEWQWRQIKSIYRSDKDLLVKHHCCINCLNV